MVKKKLLSLTYMTLLIILSWSSIAWINNLISAGMIAFFLFIAISTEWINLTCVACQTK